MGRKIVIALFSVLMPSAMVFADAGQYEIQRRHGGGGHGVGRHIGGGGGARLRIGGGRHRLRIGGDRHRLRGHYRGNRWNWRNRHGRHNWGWGNRRGWRGGIYIGVGPRYGNASRWICQSSGRNRNGIRVRHSGARFINYNRARWSALEMCQARGLRNCTVSCWRSY